MRLYLVRHGESEGNISRTHQYEHTPLSNTGKEQAKIVAKRLKRHNIDVFYASPYVRAQETAITISKIIGKPVKILDELRETPNPSELNGLHYDDPKAVKIKNKMKNNWHKSDWKYSDEESFNQLKDRSLKLLQYLLKNHRDKNVLCVCHAGIMKAIIAGMLLGEKLTPEVLLGFRHHLWTQNTGITECEYTDKYGWGLLTWNDTTHL
ncbi:histidine phosphatase family protein [Patescibacteria group bacterium]|nr:histidine phosphatase family protein [Patescibacteria group bacterium]